MGNSGEYGTGINKIWA